MPFPCEVRVVHCLVDELLDLPGRSAQVAPEPVVLLDLLNREFASAFNVCKQVDRLKPTAQDAQVLGNTLDVCRGWSS